MRTYAAWTLLALFVVAIPFAALHMSAQTRKKSGEQLFKERGCATCHGADLKGTQMAPALQSNKKKWKKEALIQYITNPAAEKKKYPRLVEMSKNYTMMQMPPNKMDAQQMKALVDFLMKR